MRGGLDTQGHPIRSARSVVLFPEEHKSLSMLRHSLAEQLRGFSSLCFCAHELRGAEIHRRDGQRAYSLARATDADLCDPEWRERSPACMHPPRGVPPYGHAIETLACLGVLDPTTWRAWRNSRFNDAVMIDQAFRDLAFGKSNASFSRESTIHRYLRYVEELRRAGNLLLTIVERSIAEAKVDTFAKIIRIVEVNMREEFTSG